MIIVEYRRNVVVDAYGRKYMQIPEPLKNAYKEGSVVETINGIKAVINYTGYNSKALYFTVEPFARDLSGRTEKLLYMHLKKMVGNNGFVVLGTEVIT